MTSYRSAGYLISALIFLGGLLPLTAKTISFDQEKCRIDIPDGWMEQKIEGNRISIVSPDQTRTFILRIGKIDPQLTLQDPAFIKSYEDSMAANGMTITDRQHLSVAGVDTYAVDSTQAVAAGTLYNRMMLTLTNGYGYGLNISKLNAKPSDDAELNGIINSFAFGAGPVPTEAIPTQVETVTAKAENSQEKEIGTRVGLLKAEDNSNAIAWDIAMLTGVLVVISLCIWTLCRKPLPA